MIYKWSSQRKSFVSRSNQSRFRDRRKRIRFPLVARVDYSWVDASGSARYGQGQTVNISERGALIASPVVPTEGTAVEIRCYLHSISTDRPKAVEFLMKATVVRVASTGVGSTGGESGFAVKAHFAEMTWPSQSAKH
jgi:PilZ domain